MPQARSGTAEYVKLEQRLVLLAMNARRPAPITGVSEINLRRCCNTGFHYEPSSGCMQSKDFCVTALAKQGPRHLSAADSVH